MAGDGSCVGSPNASNSGFSLTHGAPAYLRRGQPNWTRSALQLQKISTSPRIGVVWLMDGRYLADFSLV